MASNDIQNRAAGKTVREVAKYSCLRIENEHSKGSGAELKTLCEIYSKVEASVTVKVNEFASV